MLVKDKVFVISPGTILLSMVHVKLSTPSSNRSTMKLTLDPGGARMSSKRVMVIPTKKIGCAGHKACINNIIINYSYMYTYQS